MSKETILFNRNHSEIERSWRSALLLPTGSRVDEFRRELKQFKSKIAT